MPRSLPDDYAEATRGAYDEERRDHGVEWGRCFCGCGEKTRTSPRSDVQAGLLKGLPLRFVGSHNRTSDYHYGRRPLYSVEDRGYETPCWIWQRAMTKPGYGKYKHRWAHRWMYEEHVGPIPVGFQLHHLCEVKASVRPDHLRSMPIRDHMRWGRTSS